MTDTLVLFLPNGTVPWRWLRIADGAVAARGEGLPEPGDADLAPPVAVVPADAVTLHWAALPDRSTAQAVAAARLVVAEASAAPIADLHVAVGREPDVEERPIGVVSTAQMRAWLAMLASHGVDPAILVPSPMLLPRPEQGYVSADLGGEGVVRGPASGFANETRLTELITGGVAPTMLSRDELETAIVAALAVPVLDLRQGAFSRQRRRAVDWALLRRLAWLSVAILSVTLLISLVRIMKYEVAADSLERRADLLARQGLPRGETVGNAERQLDARLSALRGGGVGFSRTVAAVYASVRSIPGTEIETLNFESDGDLQVTVATEREGQLVDLMGRIKGYGFSVRASPFAQGEGRLTGTLTVSAR